MNTFSPIKFSRIFYLILLVAVIVLVVNGTTLSNSDAISPILFITPETPNYDTAQLSVLIPTSTPLPINEADLRLLITPDSLTLVVDAAANLSALGLSVRKTSGIRTESLVSFFDVLQLDGGEVQAGDCFVLEKDDTTPVLSTGCIARVFKREVAPSDVFWYDSRGNHLRDVAIYQDGQPTGQICPGSEQECRFRFSGTRAISDPTSTPTTTPSPMPGVMAIEAGTYTVALNERSEEITIERFLIDVAPISLENYNRYLTRLYENRFQPLIPGQQVDFAMVEYEHAKSYCQEKWQFDTQGDIPSFDELLVAYSIGVFSEIDMPPQGFYEEWTRDKLPGDEVRTFIIKNNIVQDEQRLVNTLAGLITFRCSYSDDA